ncbi:MAG: asparagine synthase (glutamine-hydrolyzing) [Chloroflexota bacterium]|nr:MAG: asparagine synthase (glutamine-hydrolyzing) [Chloroflexota bacterium]
MCGICGVVTSTSEQTLDRNVLRRMCRLLYHRGPDDEGYYFDDYAWLGVRRLSIIDLTTGNQPIQNEDGTLQLVFNGEIYNYRELRGQLEARGHLFHSCGDSEVIIHAYEEYGDDCVNHFNGMFAFAIWDSRARRLFLARDRLGIKPLYYHAAGELLVFGSELKALLAHPDVPREIDHMALDQFLTLEYIPAPRSILNGVHKLLPGHSLVFQDTQVTVQKYWSLPRWDAPPSEETCVDELRHLIEDSVRLRLVSDVPLGAFLSGGIDSSTVVANMSAATSNPVRSFSIGFQDDTYNELPYARAVAAHLGTTHHEETLYPDITGLAEQLVGHLDEPLADFSIFPTYLVSKMASDYVKVILSGDGGDELFAGYETYVAQSLDAGYRWLPSLIRQKVMPWTMRLVPPQPTKKGLVNKTKRFVEGAALTPSLKHTRWMIFLGADERAAIYRRWLLAELDGSGSSSPLEAYFEEAAPFESLAQQQYVDVKTYLPDNILTKVDRMSMAASIEARVPLLDHRIVEFALNLPPHMKLHRGRTKRILRQAMAGVLPRATLNKPKQGFSIPLKHWLRGPLRPIMMDLLSEDAVRRRGYFEPKTISRWISEHQDARANHSHRLWALMVFELWQRQVLEAF